jgi:signal transduction histidine kinase
MALRTRLFLGVGGLVALLVGAQWWWARGLASALSKEIGNVAVLVGHSMMSGMSGFQLSAPEEECPEGKTCAKRVVVHRVDAKTGETREERVVAVGPEAEKVIQETKLDVSLRVEDAPGKEAGEAKFFVFGAPHGKRVLTVSGPGTEVQRIPIPDEGFADQVAQFQKRMLLGSAGLLGLGILLAAFVAHRVSAPLSRLAGAARQVGEGSFGAQVAAKAPGEVGEAIQAFNRMSSQLAALDAKNRELRAARHLGEIGEIARGLAHALRNPLHALGLSVEELASQGDGKSEGLADSARRQIRRIDQSIRSFLALASQGGGAAAPVAVGELVQDVALEAIQDSRGKVRITVEAGDDLPPLEAVEPELRAVLQALLVNAVEASPEGGAVEISVDRAGDERVRITIDDEGPGLPEEIRARLFTPHLTTKANGSGMGLFLAHRIATTRYGGRLELEPRTAGGTSAVLEIGPRRPEEGAESDV